jgi:hypothetical protein
MWRPPRRCHGRRDRHPRHAGSSAAEPPATLTGGQRERRDQRCKHETVGAKQRRWRLATIRDLPDGSVSVPVVDADAGACDARPPSLGGSSCPQPVATRSRKLCPSVARMRNAGNALLSASTLTARSKRGVAWVAHQVVFPGRADVVQHASQRAMWSSLSARGTYARFRTHPPVWQDLRLQPIAVA